MIQQYWIAHEPITIRFHSPDDFYWHLYKVRRDIAGWLPQNIEEYIVTGCGLGQARRLSGDIIEQVHLMVEVPRLDDFILLKLAFG